MSRKASVNFSRDDYSLSDKYWEIYKKTWSSTEDQSRRRSLIRGHSIYFDYFDQNGDHTPLMKSIKLNYIKKSLNILLFGADPNIQQKTTGDTALHMAVDNGNLTLVKLLLTFNADPTIRNTSFLDPLDVADLIKQESSPSIKTALKFTALPLVSFGKSSIKRPIKQEALQGDIDGIIKALKQASHSRYKTRQYFKDNSTLPTPRNRPDDKYLLCLDGGGVRLFNALQAMVNVEQRMNELTLKQQKIHTYFDYIGGTSSGGMAACSLVYSNTDAFNGRAICLKGMLDVMAAPAGERGHKMDVMMQEIFTEDMSMADLHPSQPHVIITASLAERTPYELHLMTSYGEPRDGQAGPNDRKVWEACRITTCAPSFFPVLRDLKLLDGGLVCNNPTLDCIAEVIKQGEREGAPVKIGCVVSIGTGMFPKQESQEVEFFTTSALSYLSTKNIYALQSLIQHFVNQTTLSDGREVANAQSICSGLGCQYFRLTPSLNEEVSLSLVEEDKIINMLYDTQMYYLDNPQLIDDVAKCLLSK